MDKHQAYSLRNRINNSHPELHPEVHQIANGEFVVRLMTNGYRGTRVVKYHIWSPLSWDSYRYFVLEGRRQEVPA